MELRYSRVGNVERGEIYMSDVTLGLDEVYAIFDNGGETIDRYTIYILTEDGRTGLYATCDRPEGAGGVFSTMEDVSLDFDEIEDEQIDWVELPVGLREYMVWRIKEDWGHSE